MDPSLSRGFLDSSHNINKLSFCLPHYTANIIRMYSACYNYRLFESLIICEQNSKSSEVPFLNELSGTRESASKAKILVLQSFTTVSTLAVPNCAIRSSFNRRNCFNNTYVQLLSALAMIMVSSRVSCNEAVQKTDEAHRSA